MRLLKRIGIAYLLLCAFMWLCQRHLMYVPETGTLEPAAYGLHDFNARRITTADGTHVELWVRKAREGFPTIVYFHGNGGNMGGRAHYFKWLTDEGFGLVALDYRGYGRSEGSPSEAGFYEDARATIEYSEKNLSLQPGQMIVYGESIGTGVAVQMATEYKFEAIILQSPFTSLVAVGEVTYPWLPVSLLQTDRFDSLSKIDHVHAPLLLFHGERDSIVPFAQGQTIFEHASAPKEAVYFPDKGHVDMDVRVLAQDVLAFSRKYHLITE